MKKNPLKQYLEKNGLNQGELAQKIGISQALLSRYLSGERSFSPSRALSISKITGIPVLNLLYPEMRHESPGQTAHD